MRKIIADIILFIFLIISSFLFTKDAYAILCHGHFPAIKCSPTSNFDCEPKTGDKSCCRNETECRTKAGAAGGVVGASVCVSLPCDPLPRGCKPTDPGFADTQQGKCVACVANNQVYTALGCVATKPEDFVAQLLGWVIGLGGGIAFLLIVWGGFQIVTSSGDPEKLNSGKEIIVSALTGLLMIVFSVILLKIIGVDILQIPGLGKP